MTASPISDGMVFDLPELVRIVKNIWGRYSEGSTRSTGRYPVKLHQKLEFQQQHYFKLPEADPNLGPEFPDASKYQCDVLRDAAWKLESRLLENRFQFTVKAPKETAAQKQAAQDTETWLQVGWATAQQRQQIDIQGGLASGAVRKCYGILHSRLSFEMWPDMPPDEYLEEVPDTEPEAYEKVKKNAPEYEDGKRWKKTGAAIADQDRRNKAMAGFPWVFELVDAQRYAEVEDVGCSNGLGMVVVIKVVELIDYNGEISKYALELKPGGTPKLSLYEIDPEIPLNIEKPVDGSFNSSDTSTFITVVQLWTREEFYELAMPAGGMDASQSYYDFGSMVLIKGAKHPYGEPPFYKVAGKVNEGETDPCLKYQPSLQGVYDFKPYYDRTRSLEGVLTERIALARLFLAKQQGTLADLGDEEGMSTLPREHTETATVLPEGYSIQKIDFEINEALVRLRELQEQEIMAARPPTGQAEIAATTQPWTARQATALADVYPHMILLGMERVVQQCAVMQIRTMSKSPEEGGPPGMSYVFAKAADDKTGRLRIDPSKTVGLDPKMIPSLWVDVSINPTSAQEMASKQQLGMEALKIGLFTPERILEDYWDDPDALGTVQDYMGWQAAESVTNSVVAQRVASIYSEKIIIGQGGTAVGPNGQGMTPQEAVAQKGWAPMTPPQGAAVPGGNGMTPYNAGPTMPPLPGLAAPGTMPLPGIQG